MGFYQSISNYYHHIFPLNVSQVDYVNGTIDRPGEKSILDVGCGTGLLCKELSKVFMNVIGIDLDKAMLEQAKENCLGINNIQFYNLNMLGLNDQFDERSFDAIICFGNTLVHLNSEDGILGFLKQSYRTLKEGGKLLLQIINYDRIIDLNIDHLPTIENKHLKFERKYTYHPKLRSIDFKTILTIKANNQQISNNINLFPIREFQLLKLLEQTGFNTIKSYGNFNKDRLTDKSIPLIVESGKN